MPGGVGGVTTQPQSPHRRPPEVENAAHREHGDGLLPWSPAATGVQHAERVGGVVDDLPSAGHDRNECIFEEHRYSHATEKLKVPLRDIGSPSSPVW